MQSTEEDRFAATVKMQLAANLVKFGLRTDRDRLHADHSNASYTLQGRSNTILQKHYTVK